METAFEGLDFGVDANVDFPLSGDHLVDCGVVFECCDDGRQLDMVNRSPLGIRRNPSPSFWSSPMLSKMANWLHPG